MRGSIVFFSLLALLTLALLYVLFSTAPSPGVLAGALALSIALLGLLYAFSIKPIHALKRGMDLLRAQDYASRLRVVGQSDADNVVGLFNDLMARLKSERLRLQEQNLFLQQLIDASTQGIIIMDFDHKPMQINPAAKAMLEEIDLPALDERQSVTLRSHKGMVYKVQRLSFMDRGHRHAFYLVESLTEEVRQAELEAYGRVIRTIAHEANNTMGGIMSVLQIVRDTSSDKDIADTIDCCAERGANLTRFISDYAHLAKLPEPQTQRMGIAQSFEPMRQFLASACAQAGIDLAWNLSPRPEAMIDPVLWQQAIVNIVKNSIESIVARKSTPFAGPSGLVGDPACDTPGLIEISVADNGLTRITDNGAGLDSLCSSQIFSPFFTTKPQGQGIGLMLVSEVMRRHGFLFSLSTDPDSGLTVFEIRPRLIP